MRTRSLVTAAVAVAALLSGCTDGPGGAETSPTPSSDAAAAVRAVSQCMRSHGYPNFPDPVQDARGTWGFPPSVDGMRVTNECTQTVREAKAATRDQDREKVDAATLAKLRQYATCMRRNGLPDWPDPTEFGTFKLPPSLRPAPGQSRDAGQARFSAQDRACHSFIPAGVGVSVEG